LEIISTSIQDLYIVEPAVHQDKRGYFMESFKDSVYKENNLTNFIQDNESSSSFGVLRGLHFQSPPKEQTKLVRVISGEIQDVAVDIRKNSSSYGKHFSIILSSDNKRQLYIPKGFLHGFLVLSETAVVMYKVDQNYCSEADSGVIYNDEDLGIDWQLPSNKISLSSKDSKLESFKFFKSPF